MRRKTEDVLLELGVTPNLQGFDYICKAIEIIANSKEKLKMVDGLYMDIAKEFGITNSGVERVIRYAISKMDKNSKAWQEYIGIEGTTNSAVLLTLAMKLREG